MFYCPYLYTIPQTWWWRDVNVMICQKLSNMRLGDVMFSQKLRQFLYDRNETKRGISNFSCRKTFFYFLKLRYWPYAILKFWSCLYIKLYCWFPYFMTLGFLSYFLLKFTKNFELFICIIDRFLNVFPISN